MIISGCLIIIAKKGMADDKNYNTKLQIINKKNQIIADFMVKIVKDEEEKAKGLMFVNQLPKNYGMLFKFEPEQIVYMWMKNTKIPLDILFIDKNKQIITIKHDAIIDSADLISSQKKVIMVLEINAKMASNLGVEIGDYVRINY